MLASNNRMPRQRKVTFIGVPLDLGAGRRGVDMGPSAFRVADIHARVRSLGYEVADRGDIDVFIKSYLMKKSSGTLGEAVPDEDV